MSNEKESSKKNLALTPKRETLLEFQRSLLTWYVDNGRNFPWRRSNISKYKLVISELLLQRTNAETVAKFFDNFISQYPSWEKLAEASESEIAQAIQPIGLWRRRASTLKQLANIMVKRGGRLPKTRVELEALPGVGQYIANAILLLCHGESQPLLDANMARILERVFGPRKLADIRYDPYLQDLACTIVKCKEASKLNWAILDLAATTCKKNKSYCYKCPLITVCLAAKSG